MRQCVGVRWRGYVVVSSVVCSCTVRALACGCGTGSGPHEAGRGFSLVVLNRPGARSHPRLRYNRACAWSRSNLTISCRTCLHLCVTQLPEGGASAPSAQPAAFLFDAFDVGFRARRFMASRYKKDVRSHAALAEALTASAATLFAFAPALEEQSGAFQGPACGRGLGEGNGHPYPW